MEMIKKRKRGTERELKRSMDDESVESNGIENQKDELFALPVFLLLLLLLLHC
jgi:hypothetical protein